MIKKMLSVVAMFVVLIGMFAFDGGNNKAHATFIENGNLAGTYRCYDSGAFVARGIILNGDLVWKTSEATCYNGAGADYNGNYYLSATLAIYSSNNNAVHENVIAYLDRWIPSTSTWQQVAHTGSYTDGTTITTDSDKTYWTSHYHTFRTIRFNREYNTSTSLYSEENYRIRFGNANTTSSYVEATFQR